MPLREQAQIDAGYAQLQENEKLYTEKYAEFTSGKEQYEAVLPPQRTPAHKLTPHAPT